MDAITIYLFSLYYHHTTGSKLVELADRADWRYDLTFVCDTDIPYDDTCDRSWETNRYIFQKQIIRDLIIRKIQFFLLRGDIDARIKYVKSVLDKYRKYENLVDLI